MPPRPKYSKGCFLCRQRKIKCDEQKPHCRRCVKAGRMCPGFPAVTNFLSMNGDFGAPGPLLPHPVVRLSHSFAQQSDPRPASPSSNITALLAQPSTDWVRHAVCYFIQNFVSEPKTGGPGYLQFLPDILSSADVAECLQDSLNAVSMMSLANVSNAPGLHIQSQQLYCRALHSASLSLSSCMLENDAAFLTSIFLLQKREALNRDVADSEFHEVGLIQLLQARATRKPRNVAEMGLFYTIRSRLQIRSMDGEGCQAKGLEVFDSSNVLTGVPLNSLESLFDLVAKFRRQVQRLIALPQTDRIFDPTCRAEVSQLLDIAFWTNQQLEDWPRTISQDFLFREIDASLISGTPSWMSAEAKIYAFADLQHGCQWQAYWSSRIQLLRSMLDALDLASQIGVSYEPALPRDTIHSQMQKAADSICYSVPFMLGEVDPLGKPQLRHNHKGQALGAYFLTRFLHIANQVPLLPRQQRKWTLDYLFTLGMDWGIGSALRCRTKWLQVYADSPD